VIKINGEEWRVVEVSPFHPSFKRSDGTYTIGCCDDLTKCIYISNDLNKKYFKKVLCHELTHAAMYSYNIDLTYEQEELLADIIATYGEEIIEITNLLFSRLINQKRKREA
jgi:hypothetical protein